MKYLDTVAKRPDAFIRYITDTYFFHLETYGIYLCQKFPDRSMEPHDIIGILTIKIHDKYPTVLKGYREKGLPYLLRMMKHIYLGSKRKDQNHKNHQERITYHLYGTLKDEPQEPPEIHDEHFDLQFSDFFKLFKEVISPADFEILSLNLEGHQYDEIAGLVQRPIGTIGVRLHRIRKRLKEKYKNTQGVIQAIRSRKKEE